MIYKCSMTFLEALAGRRGYKLAEARACIVNREGETLTVDTDSPAYPRDRNPSPAQQAVINTRLDATIGQTLEHGCGCVKRQL